MGKSHRAKRLIALATTLLATIGVAGAQEAPASEDSVFQGSVPPGAPAAVAADGAGALAPPEEENLTPAQMFERAKSTLARLEGGADNIRRQLGEARQTRDVVKALCLDDKLNQMDVAKRTASDRVAGLEVAAQTNNLDRARHEFAVIDALGERGSALIAEANQCIGEETGFVGESRVTLSVDPNIPDFDPAIPTDPIVSVPPVLNSPTL